MVAEWLSLGERLTLQSVSKDISCQLEHELERGVWDSLKNDSWAFLSNEWDQYCWETQRNAFALSEG